MNLILALLPVVALATWQTVETLHHGSIFAKTRAYCEVRGGFFCELFLCPFCLSHWVATALTALIFQSVFKQDWTISEWGLVPIYILAVTRLSNLLNDMTHEWCRTPGRNAPSQEDLDALAKLSEKATEDANGQGSDSASGGGEGTGAS